MKRKELKRLIEEHLSLRRSLDTLQKRREKLEDRYEEVGILLYGYRSKKFLRSVLSCLLDLRREHGADPYFDDLVQSVAHTLKHEDIEARKHYTPKDLLHLYDEEVEW
jgi:hypothetical protein